MQRRTVRVLVLAQAVGALGITIGIATASLLARDLSGSESLAGLAQTAQVLGAAVASYLLARLMSRRGRRIGLATGYLLGAAGGGARGGRRRRRVDAAADGRGRAARVGHRRQLRCAVRRHRPGPRGDPGPRAVDRGLGDHDRRGRRTQPDRARRAPSPRALDIPELTGPFAIGAAGMLLAALIVGRAAAPRPAAGGPRGRPGSPAVEPTGTSWDRAGPRSRERPVLAFAVAGLAAAHAAMIGVMVMTPLHMEHGGAELEVIGVVISVHVLGMFAFSPLVGMLADRLGRDAGAGRERRRSWCCRCCCARGRPRVRTGRSSPGCSCSGSAGRSRWSPPRR